MSIMMVQHNAEAMFANRELKVTTGLKAKSSERLASGYRINRAADDAAGLSISEKLRWQVRGLDKASTNIQDGISFLQTGEGALNEVHDMLHRIKELSIQASNDTNTDTDRNAINEEVQQIKKEMNRIFCMLLLFDFTLRSIFLRTVVRVWTDRSPNIGILRYVF